MNGTESKDVCNRQLPCSVTNFVLLPRADSIPGDIWIDRVHFACFYGNPLRRTQAYMFRLNFARNPSFFYDQNILESYQLRRWVFACDGVS